MAEAASLDLRIFTRDGQRFSQSQQPSLVEAPDSNADLMAKFMNVKNGQAWQSIPSPPSTRETSSTSTTTPSTRPSTTRTGW